MNKKLLLRVAMIAMFIGGSHFANAQGVSVNTTGNDPDGSAMLDVSSTTQGMLVPRMNSTQRGLIGTPATGLLVYQTDAPTGFYFYNGTTWVSLSTTTGTVTNASVVNANGFAGSVATSTTTPAITVSTTVTGILKGDGTAVSAATAGTDYLTPTGSGAGLSGVVTSVSGTADRITSTGGATPVIDISSTFEATLGLVAQPLSQFAATTSAQLAGVISDETGTGLAVFSASPALSGVPTAPTAANGTNTTQIATTAFVLANGTSFAAPAANSVTLSAPTAGVATTAMRSDATLQLSQSITPTWTGLHTFNNSITMGEGSNIATGTTTGTKIGTTTSQKIGFYNATPVVQQTGNISTALSNLGLVTSGTIALASNVTGVLPVANGGTGTSTAPTQGGVIFGSSTTAYGSTAAGTSGQYLQSAGTGTPVWANLGALNNVQVFTSSGTYIPTAGTTKIVVELIGGGGGGGGAAIITTCGGDVGGGGGAGAYVFGIVNSPGTTAVTIGAGGTAGAATGTAGGTGGSTIFGSFNAGGGAGGNGEANQTVIHRTPGGNGGFGSGGILNLTGSPGWNGMQLFNNANTGFCFSGAGGGTKYGDGGRPVGGINNGSLAGVTPTAYGAGGSGAVANFPCVVTSAAGGAGAPGIVIIYEYK